MAANNENLKHSKKLHAEDGATSQMRRRYIHNEYERVELPSGIVALNKNAGRNIKDCFIL